jgi:hypothetical protein
MEAAGVAVAGPFVPAMPDSLRCDPGLDRFFGKQAEGRSKKLIGMQKVV